MSKVKIEVLGTGCPKCKKLLEVAEQAGRELGVNFELVKVTDIKEILARGVMSTPALVVNGQVKISGKLPSVEQVKKLLS